MADKKTSEKEIEEKMKDLKVSLLNPKSKRKDIKREIARLLTIKAQSAKEKTK
jgi:ribosomal protein L29